MLDRIISLTEALFNIKTDFHRVFYRNELHSLIGKNRRSLLTLTGIFLLSWFSLGYATGGLRTLAKRMNNPFTNWVDWPIPNGSNTILTDVSKYLADPAVRDSFYLKGMSGYCREMREFKHNISGQMYYKRGRTMDPDDALFKRILNEQENNVIAGLRYATDDKWDVPMCGLVVKEEMLINLGYENPAAQKLMPVPIDSGMVYLPIVAVVKDLPNLSDFIYTPKLFNAFNSSYDKTGFILNKIGSVHEMSVLINEPDKTVAEKKIKTILSEYPVNKIDTSVLRINDRQTRYCYRIIFESTYEYALLAKMEKKLEQDWGQKGAVEPFINWDCPAGHDDLDPPYYEAFYFSRLDKIQSFKATLQQRFKIDLSMDQIEAKENFALVSRLTYLISLALFGFSIASVILFINNKLKNHLEQNKATLGTFKAFGLSDRQLKRIYATVVFSFLLLGFGLAAACALVFAAANQALQFSIITLLHPTILLAFGLLFAISLIVTVRTIHQILKETPGNLIYGR